MKNIVSLIRRQPAFDTYRRYYGNVNMARRKDLRRIKKINIHNKEISGQQNPNVWFTPKKLKALGNMIQTRKNNHTGTNPVAKEIQQELLDTMIPMADHQYWLYRNRHYQLVEYKDKIARCDIEHVFQKMPAKLRNAIQNDQQNPMPQILQPLLKFTEQMQVFLPQDERYRYNLMLKITHPPKVKLETEE